jgi:hypothetical protein
MYLDLGVSIIVEYVEGFFLAEWERYVGRVCIFTYTTTIRLVVLA